MTDESLRVGPASTDESLRVGPASTDESLRVGPASQATVAGFDPADGSGELLTDDGTRLTFPPAAFHASGLRLVRVGQRVRVERDAVGGIVRIALPTMP